MLPFYLIGLGLIFLGLLHSVFQMAREADAKIRRQLLTRVLWQLVALSMQVTLLLK